MEQALKSGTCSALLGWLDPRHVTPQVLRRLQLAARSGGTLAFLFRPERGPGGFPGRATPASGSRRSAQEVRLRSEASGAGLEPFELA